MATKKLTFFTLAQETIRQLQRPLSANEIWIESEEIRKKHGFISTGKTPSATIAAYMYTNIQAGQDKSTFIQVSKRPAKFFLRELQDLLQDTVIIADDQTSKPDKIQVKERDLHPLVVGLAGTLFNAHIKTIYHEKSSKKRSGQNKWLHPDLVGVYFPFDSYDNNVLELQGQLAVSSIKIYSFELKVDLDFSNLRESYFQTVSNSSWATEGYLVTLNIESDPVFREELRRLNNSHGIGVIVLNPENLFESEVSFPSRINSELDWDTVERLRDENPDFDAFIQNVNEDLRLRKVKSNYDRRISEEQLEKHIKDKLTIKA